MKKLSFISESLKASVWCLAMIMSVCMIGLSSCGNDEDEDNGIDTNAPYTGKWVVNHLKIESTELETVIFDEDIEPGYIWMNLKSDGTFVTYDEGEEDNGTWNYSADTKKLGFNYYPYDGDIETIKVTTWTSKVLRTISYEDGLKMTATWKK